MTEDYADIRSALYLPASNARAIEKARSLPCDMVILDLEDSVKPEDKDRARTAAVEASGTFGETLLAIRINPADAPWHEADIAAVSNSAATLAVLPKVEFADETSRIAEALGRPLFAMVETPAGVLAAPAIAGATGVAGLIVGPNDLSAALRLPPESGRAGLSFALQAIVLAARAAGIAVLDGVWNRLDDPDGFAAECRAGRALGFDGKTLIHPGQIDIANAAFGPSEAEIEDAEALIAAATGGAERFRGRMVETMHVETARRLLKRARRGA